MASYRLNSTNHFETAGVSVTGEAAAGATLTVEVSVTVGVPAVTSGVGVATAGAVSTTLEEVSSFFVQAARASRTVRTNSERIINSFSRKEPDRLGVIILTRGVKFVKG